MLAAALSSVLAFGTIVVADVAPCRADETPAAVSSAPAPDAAAAPRPGTDEEERAYARREAESPGTEEFSGGQVVEVLLIVALVLVIILLAKEL
jgi:hypothetical protein